MGLSDSFYDGVWIDGAPYVVCLTCGAFVPANDDTLRHYNWHQELENRLSRIEDKHERY